MDSAITVEIEGEVIWKRANGPLSVAPCFGGTILCFTVRESPGTRVELFLSSDIRELLRELEAQRLHNRVETRVEITNGAISGQKTTHLILEVIELDKRVQDLRTCLNEGKA